MLPPFPVGFQWGRLNHLQEVGVMKRSVGGVVAETALS